MVEILRLLKDGIEKKNILWCCNKTEITLL